MLYEQTVHTNSLASSFCSLHQDAYQREILKTQLHAEDIVKEFKGQRLPWLMVSEPNECDEFIAEANRISARYKNVMVLGMGGASLCGQVLVSLLKQPNAAYGRWPSIYFVETLDPVSISALFSQANPNETAYLVISKTGKTIETLTQASLFYVFTKNFLGREPDPGQFTIITDPRPSPLCDFAAAVNAKLLFHIPTIGGRYSIFTNVGLLPAAIAGLNIKEICQGAKMTLEKFSQDSCSPVIKGAAAQSVLYERGIQQAVFMTYCDRLVGLVDWVRQMYAESLGKSGEGITPIKALGTMDQHSQLQLFLDGPKDKWFTVFGGVPEFPHLEVQFPPAFKSWNNGLEGRKLSDIVDIEYRATISALRSRDYPLRTFRIDVLDEKTIGALAMHFMLETMVLAKLMQVDAYDQPAVEIGKRFAAELLAQPYKK